MSKLPLVSVYFNSTLGHFSQLLTGLEMLRIECKIDLKYEICKKPLPIDLMQIKYNDLNLIFDMADNSQINVKVLNECDFYIKRMLLKSDYKKYQNVLPFGLNYQVYHPNKFLKSLLFTNKKKFWKYSLRYNSVLSALLGINDSTHTNNIGNMHSNPSDSSNIVFRARLWNPDNNDEKWKKKERREINSERITIVEELKKKYSTTFNGGVQKDSFSIDKCPDILISSQDYNKKKYLNILRNSSIGIVNPGLEKSISWKFGEYMAFSLAIVSNSIEKYQLLSNIEDGQNYLSYRTIDECMDKVKFLMDHDSCRKKMQSKNNNYYRNYLHPAKKMMHIFDLISRS